jgi:solute carrier family 25 (mitochondrial S-adenosylmethionine transporter), member 26
MPGLRFAARPARRRVAAPGGGGAERRLLAFALRRRRERAVAPTPAAARAESLRAVRENLACGAIARFSQNISMYPVDTIKTRVQVSRNLGGATGGGGVAKLREAVSKGGLYRGLPLSLVGNVPYGMITFGLYETIKSEVFEKRFARVPKSLAIVLSACIGDAVGSLALTPAEVVKSKTQARLYENSMAAVRSIAAKGGVRGFYQGYGAALSRDLPFRAIQLTLYENARQRYSAWVARRHGREMTAVENLVMGAVTGTCTAALTTPLDVIRTRMMSQSPGSGAAYASATDCFLKTVRNEGFVSLYKGIIPRVALIGPSAAIFFVAYEQSKSWFRDRQLKVLRQASSR